jgi:threonine dehydrogenase-like Zn-dependent dehydrogenase
MKKPNAAVVGLGFVGRAHLGALRRLGISVQGNLGSSPERTKAAAESLGLPRAFESLEELAADKSVNVVHLCTPNYLHFQESSQLLRAGKLCSARNPYTMDDVRPKSCPGDVSQRFLCRGDGSLSNSLRVCNHGGRIAQDRSLQYDQSSGGRLDAPTVSRGHYW